VSDRGDEHIYPRRLARSRRRLVRNQHLRERALALRLQDVPDRQFQL
jgi:hypothetical protein